MKGTKVLTPAEGYRRENTAITSLYYTGSRSIVKRRREDMSKDAMKRNGLKHLVCQLLEIEQDGLSIPELIEKLEKKGIKLDDVFYVDGRATSPTLNSILLELRREGEVIFLPQVNKYYRLRH